MHFVGTDRITVVSGQAEPAGDWHAVDADGAVSCRTRPVVYRFPAVDWPAAEQGAPRCADCVAALAEPEPMAVGAGPVLAFDPYPTAVPAPAEPVLESTDRPLWSSPHA